MSPLLFLFSDVDTNEPDEKSLITYISSMYETFPEPPQQHPLHDGVRIPGEFEFFLSVFYFLVVYFASLIAWCNFNFSFLCSLFSGNNICFLFTFSHTQHTYTLTSIYSHTLTLPLCNLFLAYIAMNLSCLGTLGVDDEVEVLS